MFKIAEGAVLNWTTFKAIFGGLTNIVGETREQCTPAFQGITTLSAGYERKMC